MSLHAALKAATPAETSWKHRESTGGGIGSPPVLWRVVTLRLIRETCACTLSGTSLKKARSASSNVTDQSGFAFLKALSDARTGRKLE